MPVTAESAVSRADGEQAATLRQEYAQIDTLDPTWLALSSHCQPEVRLCQCRSTHVLVALPVGHSRLRPLVTAPAASEWIQESLVLVDEPLVIRTRGLLQAGSISDAYMSAVVLDQAAILQCRGRLTNRRPTHREDACEAFLGVGQIVTDGPVGSMADVATYRGLRDRARALTASAGQLHGPESAPPGVVVDARVAVVVVLVLVDVIVAG